MSLQPATVHTERFTDSELSRITEFIDEAFYEIVGQLGNLSNGPISCEVTYGPSCQESESDEYRYLVVNDKIRSIAFVRRTDFNHYELMLTSLKMDQDEFIYDKSGKPWDAKTFAHIHAVGPAFSDSISNWPDWKAEFNQALIADGRHVPTERAVEYWSDIRQNYFYRSMNPIETLKAFYYAPHSD